MKKISVIIPVLNEQDSIENLLYKIINQTYKADEIIICDGGSSDNTLNLINKIQIDNRNIHITDEKSTCRGSGRNIAINMAKNNLVAMIDAGTYPEIDWLKTLHDNFLNDNSLLICYGVVRPIINNRFDNCLSTVILSKYYKDNILFPSITSILIQKKCWNDVGKFPYSVDKKYVVEDLIFLDNLKKYKFKFIIEKNAIVNWH